MDILFILGKRDCLDNKIFRFRVMREMSFVISARGTFDKQITHM